MDDALTTPGRCPIPVDIYTHDLYLSHYLQGWAEAVEQEARVEHGPLDAEYLRGYAKALRDMRHHLQEGDALPGGLVYERVRETLGPSGVDHTFA